MIGVVATLKVKPDQVAAFEQVMSDLARATRANEPGVKVYQYCKSRKEPTTYIVMELYQDQATLDAHMGSEWFRAAGPKLQACLADRPSLDMYDTID